MINDRRQLAEVYQQTIDIVLGGGDITPLRMGRK